MMRSEDEARRAAANVLRVLGLFGQEGNDGAVIMF
jgi:hypothetical protein